MNQLERMHQKGIEDALRYYGLNKEAWIPPSISKSIITPTFKAISNVSKPLIESGVSKPFKAVRTGILERPKAIQYGHQFANEALKYLGNMA